jgi:hypothetical protein
MTTEQSRTREHVACVRGQAEVTAALEACDLILSRLRAVDRAFYGLRPPGWAGAGTARRLADELGRLLDELVERDPGAPGEEWPDLTVHPAGCACGDPDCLASRYRPAPTR